MRARARIKFISITSELRGSLVILIYAARPRACAAGEQYWCVLYEYVQYIIISHVLIKQQQFICVEFLTSCVCYSLEKMEKKTEHDILQFTGFRCIYIFGLKINNH